jgi:lysozyme
MASTSSTSSSISRTRVGVASLVVSAAGLVGIASDEDFRAAAYRDIGGIWTIGYGETKGVKPGQTTNPRAALQKLEVRVEEHAQGVRACVRAPLHQHEFDAYVSLAYNVGVQGFCSSSIPGLLAQGQYTAACDRLMQFNKVRINGELREVSGLTVRRLKERSRCLGEGNHV